MAAAGVAILGLLAAGCQQQGGAVNEADLRAFAQDYAAAWSGQDPVAYSQFYADEGTLRINDGEPSVGRAAVEATARSFMTNFPDMLVELVDLRLDGDDVQFHWRWTGTNTGPGGTGAAVDLTGYEVWTLNEDGLILYSQGYMDDAEYQRQLNAGPAQAEDAAEVP